MDNLDSTILYATLKTVLALGMGVISVTIMLKLRSRYGKEAVLVIPGCVIGGLLAIFWIIALIEFIKKGDAVGIVVCALIPAIITGIVFLIIFLKKRFKEKQAKRIIKKLSKINIKNNELNNGPGKENPNAVLNPQIQQRAVEMLLENNELTAAETAELLMTETEGPQYLAIKDSCRLLGVSAENGRLKLDPVFQSRDPRIRAELEELLGELDCGSKFEQTDQNNSKVRYLD